MALDSTFGKDALANHFGDVALYGALYTTAPTGGAQGTEVTGGSPAYARKPLTWSAPSAGVSTATATFDVPACTVLGSGVHDAVTAGNYVAGKTESSTVFAGQDTVDVTFTITVA